MEGVMLQQRTLFEDMFDFIRDFDELRCRMEEMRARPGEALASRKPITTGLTRREFLPAVECFTRGERLVLRAELPGVDPHDVELSILGDQMILRGEKKDVRRVDEKDLFLRETRHGRFERSFSLPRGVKTDQIEARFENGVLEVTLPAGKAESARKIPIEIVETGRSPVKAA